jgi:conjugative transfer signal peptidase TraF
MSPLTKRLSLWAASAVGVVAAISAGAYVAGIRINTTNSIPRGVYITTSDPVAVGSYVIVCPPDIQVFREAKARGYVGPGFCPGGYGNLMKRVLAAKNDQVTVSPEGLTVNGSLLPYSKPSKADKAGRPLPAYQSNAYTLGNLEVLLMSDVSLTSFDGRYFGPLNISQVRSVIRPVFTF